MKKRSLDKEFNSFDFFSMEEAVQTKKQIIELRSCWRKPWSDTENLSRPFFTLGAPSYPYSFAGMNIHDYLQISAEYNLVLKEHFSHQYHRIASFFEDTLGDRVILNPCGFSYPGFHIFLGHPDFQSSENGFHADCQHYFLPWPKKVQYNEHWTFTIAVSIPKSGAYFEWKTVPYLSKKLLGDHGLQEALENVETHTRSYEIGKIVIHSGLFFHRIGAWKSVDPDDSRITLQGHLVKVSNEWLLYW